MNYFSFSFEFTSPVHFGQGSGAGNLSSTEMTFCADMLFSALCNVALRKGGETELKKLVGMCKNGDLLLSDALPCSKDSVWLPRPFLLPQAQPKNDEGAKNRKDFKKLKYIAAENYDDFITSLNGGDIPALKNKIFGCYSIAQKVMVVENDDSEPYSVGLFSFNEGFGLCVIVGCSEKKHFDYFSNLAKILQFDGIGGKISSGYGKFKTGTLFENGDLSSSPNASKKALFKMLSRSSADQYISLTSSLPKEEELESAMDGALFKTVRRGGFISSTTYSETLEKKKTQYFLAAGSTFKRKYEGDVYDISNGGSHPVYRYGKPIFMGVKYSCKKS